MILVVPYEVRTLTTRLPWANYLLIGLNVVFFLLLYTDKLPDEWIYQMVLTGWYAYELLGHQFLHAGWMHLLSNMAFLWVFGNALAGVMNQGLYLAFYLVMGVCAAAIHLLVDGHPMVGASGAISGVLGIYLAVYPVNRIHCFYFFMIRPGFFDAQGFLLILLWFLLNLLPALFSHGTEIAYVAHVGGFVAGFLIGLLCLHRGWIDIGSYDNPTTMDYFTGRAARM